MTTTRISRRFAELQREGRAGFVAFVMAGDPDRETSLAILKGLPDAGADLIEIGMPFSDPMADGPAIQEAGQRALKAGMTLTGTINIVREFRADDNETPVVLMGYYNPIHHYGVERFVADAIEAGVDGLIIVDLPPEEDDELCLPAIGAGLHFIRLAAPTTDEQRLPALLRHTGGFLYYVSITGTTGAAAAEPDALKPAVARLRAHTDLPIAVGFGIRTPGVAAEVARIADAAVVGSAFVTALADHLDEDGRPQAGAVDAVLGLARQLSDGVRNARLDAAE